MSVRLNMDDTDWRLHVRGFTQRFKSQARVTPDGMDQHRRGERREATSHAITSIMVRKRSAPNTRNRDRYGGIIS